MTFYLYFQMLLYYLVQSELIKLQNDKDYALTNQGEVVSKNLYSIDSKRLQILIHNASVLMDKLQNVSILELYKTLRIRL